ncbi:catechol 2,3-dioxygenase [Marinococcus luteus]|uniref:Catechol 2,3-dioxygenase n=1 Tax=Marinococcus luteus TaxID=1122204 RepID=A0A1H2WXD1_9BACI|nr:VOC family protein [Marinococcus luteus]SDW85333.1 catechol 2,3-dioxygenase [Marinococcus luteus]
MTNVIDPAVSVGPVQLRVQDIRRAAAYYENVIGLRILGHSSSTAVLGVPSDELPLVMLREVEGSVTPPRTYAGLYHFAVLLPDRASLGALMRHLHSIGERFGASDHSVSEALYLTDPDGNGIEVYRDRPRTEWKYDSNGFVHMTVDPLHEQQLLQEGENTQWHGLPARTVMGHVHLHVQDMEKAYRFYVEVLGFELTADPQKFPAFFAAAGGYHHHIGLNSWAGAQAPKASIRNTGIDMYTLLLPSDQSLEPVAERLEAAGYPFHRKEHALYVTDPSGIVVCLTVNPPDTVLSSAQMVQLTE